MADEAPKKRRGNPNWVKGVGGNPGGRKSQDHVPRTSKELDVMMLAREWTPEAIRVAAELMRNVGYDENGKPTKPNMGAVPPATRLAAADLLLKRGHGNPIQPHANPDLTPLNFAEMSDDALLENLGRLDSLLAKAQGPLKDAIPGPGGKGH